MDIAKITGSIWATRKDDRLQGMKLLVADLGGIRCICGDIIGAGIGDTVIITRGGSAKCALGDIPADAAVVAIVDKIEEGE